MKTFNVYCDESCHLENDKQKVMVLGALWSLPIVLVALLLQFAFYELIFM